MTASNDEWKTRYYELEQTLEQMLKAFQKVLADQNGGAGDRASVWIRRISFISSGQEMLLCCIADGTNLEYSFEFFADGKAVKNIPFGPINAAEIPREINSGNPGSSRCVIKVRSLEDEVQTVTAQEVQL